MGSKTKPQLEDLFYELRMLLGASKLRVLFSDKLPGNIENYFKDSVYMHSRNLYNFFTKARPKHDGSITQYGESVIASNHYPNPWEGGINNRVMHIYDRNNSMNIKHGVMLNEMTEEFANDIENLWTCWINQTADPVLKVELQEALKKAQKQADDDHKAAKKILEEHE